MLKADFKVHVCKIKNSSKLDKTPETSRLTVKVRMRGVGEGRGGEGGGRGGGAVAWLDLYKQPHLDL